MSWSHVIGTIFGCLLGLTLIFGSMVLYNVVGSSSEVVSHYIEPLSPSYERSVAVKAIEQDVAFARDQSLSENVATTLKLLNVQVGGVSHITSRNGVWKLPKIDGAEMVTLIFSMPIDLESLHRQMIITPPRPIKNDVMYYGESQQIVHFTFDPALAAGENITLKISPGVVSADGSVQNKENIFVILQTDT